jgi:hypothetical protein
MTATFPSSFPIMTPFGRSVEFSAEEWIFLAVDENRSRVLTFCLFVGANSDGREAAVDSQIHPIHVARLV